VSDQPRILVVDDERQILRALKVILREAGYDVVEATTVEEALDRASVRPPDAAIVDLMLPDGSGVELCRRLREWTTMPILVLSAIGDEETKVEALEAGADDYLTKPPRRLELISRVHALWRRATGTEAAPKVLDHPPYRLDLAERRAHLDGAPIELTPKEFEVAWVLFNHLGRLISRSHLLEAVWGQGEEVATRTVDSHVSRMRSKLDLQPERGFRLVSVYGYGYRLEPTGAP
jgi:two-component system KDP operon response regulator KdpE